MKAMKMKMMKNQSMKMKLMKIVANIDLKSM